MFIPSLISLLFSALSDILKGLGIKIAIIAFRQYAALVLAKALGVIQAGQRKVFLISAGDHAIVLIGLISFMTVKRSENIWVSIL